jgi:hypothetical protein
MKTLNFVITGILTIFSSALFAQRTPDDICGKYKTNEEGAIIKILKKDGKVIAYDPSDKQTLYNLKVEDGLLKGTVTDNRKNLTANCIVTLSGSTLKIVAKKAFITKTVYWTKISEK